MAANVSVNPALLRWARERASLSPPELARRVGLKESRVVEWETSGQLSLAQLERLATKTQTPVGFLFLPEPPQEELPIPDFRTIASARMKSPSPNLLDTIYQCQQRQNWYREELMAEGEEPLAFVGSASLKDPAAAVARQIREALGLDIAARRSIASWEAALASMVEKAEARRILVMRNSVVGNNTHRKLDVNEFRGFALADAYAPVAFINAADARSAQMFTLAHEIAHLWLGQTGVSDLAPDSGQVAERYCNTVAAEILVPLEEFLATWRQATDPLEEAERLAREFKVSTQVVLFRAREAGALPEDQFWQLYRVASARSRGAATEGGGDFYRTQGSRLGKRFARAVILSALEGRTTYGEALQLLGVRKVSAFEELGRRLKVIP